MDSLARTLAKKNFGVDRGELTVEGIPVGVLAEKYGTPVFI